MQKNKAVGLKDMKRMNKATFLITLWKFGELSRIELSEKTGLSPATITSLSDELIKENRILELGAKESTGGRKAVLLKINPTGGYICVIDVTGKNIRCTLLDFELTFVSESIMPNSEEIIIQSLYENITLYIDSLLSKNDIHAEELVGIGINVPQDYDLSSKKVMFDTGVSVDRMHIDEALSFYYKTAVFIEEEINTHGIAELHLGTTKAADDFIFMDVNEDIKAVIVQQGEIVQSGILQNNDIGHMIIDRHGPKCSCGRRGCLQMFASTAAITRKALLGLEDGKDTALKKYVSKNTNSINFDVITKYSNQGDTFIKDIINEVADSLCIGILNFSSIFNIKNIIISGKVRNIDYFKEALSKASVHHRLKEENGLMVKLSSLKDEAVVVGCGAIVLNNYFKNI
jgi:N-acetylglucosamine repressor